MSVFADLNPPYSTIVADPPWRYYGSPSGMTKGDPALRYATMSVEGIAALPVGEIAADDAHLWLWLTNWCVEGAYQVARAWGFKPITLVTWCKPQPGLGYYLRNNTEHAIFATRGKPMVPEDKPMSTWFVWPRGRHSAKPAAFGDLVEQVSPGPYLEMFAREPRLGWDSWGKGYEQAVA